jgi:hypothetical protein
LLSAKLPWQQQPKETAVVLVDLFSHFDRVNWKFAGFDGWLGSAPEANGV